MATTTTTSSTTATIKRVLASTTATGTTTSTSAGAGNSSFCVLPPFNESARYADLVLRSCDGVDFRVMKGILALASPIFQDMMVLAKPQPAPHIYGFGELPNFCIKAYADGPAPASSIPGEETSEDGLPIVTMFESNAVVLDTLLRLLYPVETPKLDNFDVLAGVLLAAQKYEMSLVLYKIEKHLQNIVLGLDSFQGQNQGHGSTHTQEWSQKQKQRRSLEVYALACEHKLESLAHLAAKECLKCPDSGNSEYFSGLDRISGGALFRLITYQRRVSDEVDRLVFEPSPTLNSRDIPSSWRCLVRELECPLKITKPKESCGVDRFGHKLPAWWATLRETARCEIQRAPLSDRVISCGILAQAVCSSSCCEECRMNVFRNLERFERIIREEIWRVASAVKLERPW